MLRLKLKLVSERGPWLQFPTFYDNWAVVTCADYSLVTWSGHQNPLQWRHNGSNGVTSITIVYPTVYSGADQRKHQRSASLAIVRLIQRSPVNYPHKWPATRKMCPFDDVIIQNYRERIFSYFSLEHINYFRKGSKTQGYGQLGTDFAKLRTIKTHLNMIRQDAYSLLKKHEFKFCWKRNRA